MCHGGVPACLYECFFVIFVLLSFDLNVSVPFHLNVFLCWEQLGGGVLYLTVSVPFCLDVFLCWKKGGGMFKYAFGPYLLCLHGNF
jgi:hypothetical protein